MIIWLIWNDIIASEQSIRNFTQVHIINKLNMKIQDQNLRIRNYKKYPKTKSSFRSQLVKQTAELLEMIRTQNYRNNRILHSSNLSPNLTSLELIEHSRSNELDKKRLEFNVTALKLKVLRLNDIKQSQSKTANGLLAQLRQSEKTTSSCRLELDAKLGKLVALKEEAERLRIRSQIRDLGKTLIATTAEEELLIKQILV